MVYDLDHHHALRLGVFINVKTENGIVGIPYPDDSELQKLIHTLAENGEGDLLRLFSCWCARQLQTDPSWSAEFIEFAEKVARGEVSNSELKQKCEASRNTACTAVSVGWQHYAMNAAVHMAGYSTINPDPAIAAEHAAHWQRNYQMMAALRKWKDPQKVSQVGNELVKEQFNQLGAMAFLKDGSRP